MNHEKPLSSYEQSRQYIIKKYNVPADIKRGTAVIAFYNKPGRITGFGGAYVIVRFKGQKRCEYVHPLELAYGNETWEAAQQRVREMNERIAKFNEALNRK